MAREYHTIQSSEVLPRGHQSHNDRSLSVHSFGDVLAWKCHPASAWDAQLTRGPPTKICLICRADKLVKIKRSLAFERQCASIRMVASPTGQTQWIDTLIADDSAIDISIWLILPFQKCIFTGLLSKKKNWEWSKPQSSAVRSGREQGLRASSRKFWPISNEPLRCVSKMGGTMTFR
jgi:hypothetical protein